MKAGILMSLSPQNMSASQRKLIADDLGRFMRRQLGSEAPSQVRVSILKGIPGEWKVGERTIRLICHSNEVLLTIC